MTSLPEFTRHFQCLISIAWHVHVLFVPHPPKYTENEKFMRFLSWIFHQKEDFVVKIIPEAVEMCRCFSREDWWKMFIEILCWGKQKYPTPLPQPGPRSEPHSSRGQLNNQLPATITSLQLRIYCTESKIPNYTTKHTFSRNTRLQTMENYEKYHAFHQSFLKNDQFCWFSCQNLPQKVT